MNHKVLSNKNVHIMNLRLHHSEFEKLGNLAGL